MNINDIITESQRKCPHCSGPVVEYSELMEKKDACYYKVKASAKVWPSAYASGRLVQCRKKGAANYGNKNESQGVAEGLDEAVGGNYLYHATSDTGLKSILQSGAINAARGAQSATNAQTQLPTVSTTRDWGYASGSNAAKQGQGGIARSAILVLDRNAIEQRYKTLGTSQSSNTRGSAFGKKKSSGFDTFKFLKPFDINKDNTLSKDELDVWQQQTGGKASPTSNMKTNPEEMARLYRDIAQGQARSKLGGEFEEAVVVPKGALLLGGGVLVGFWVNPNGTLMNDPTVMNDPRRLEIAPGGTGRFVKAKQTQGVAEDFNAEYDDEAGMFKNDLQTIQRVSTHLEKAIYDNENLPEWCQAKIAQAKGMVVAVMDYMISQHENGIVDTVNEQFDLIEEMVLRLAEEHEVDADVIWEDFEAVDDDELYEAAAWQKKSGKNKNGGLNKKGVDSYRREHPGSKLQTAVTTKPSKLKPGSKAAKRRKSFCARMKGMKKHRTGAKTKRDPNSRINKSLRKWNC